MALHSSQLASPFCISYNKYMNNPNVLALVSIVIWSFGPALGRLISLKTQFLLTGVAYFFALIVFLIYNHFKDTTPFSQKLKQSKPIYFLIGLFGYSIFSLSFIQTFRAYNSASEPTILNYTWPVFTVLFTEIFFRLKKKRDVTLYLIEGSGIILGFIAIVILITQGNIASFHIENIRGLMWGLVTGGSYGFFSAYSSTIPRERQRVFLLSAIFSSLIFTSLLSFNEIAIIPTLSAHDFLVAALLGVFVNGIAYITWTRANRLLREKNKHVASIASLTFFLPILSLLVITFLFKENTLFHPYFLLALILLIISSILCQKADTAEDNITMLLSKK